MTVYRTVGAWGPGLGRLLTPVEQDTNLYGLDQRVETLEGTIVGAGIDSITQSVPGGAISVHLDNGDVEGPFQLPVASMRWRGDWVAATTYYTLDIVHVPGTGHYLVTADHTSAAAFDAAAYDSNGTWYQYLFPSHVSGKLTVTTTTLSPTRAANNGRYHRCTNSAGCTVYLDSDEFSENDEMFFRQCGAGPVSFIIDSAGIINPADGEDTITAKRGSVACVKYIGGGEFDIFGGMGSGS